MKTNRIVRFTIVGLIFAGCGSADISERGIYWASWKGNTDEVRTILEKRPDLAKSVFASETQRTPLHVAANAEIAQMLLDHGADPLAPDQYGTPPIYSVRGGDVVELLAKKGADINGVKENARFETPLGLAIMQNRSSVAMALLRLGADWTRVDGEGETYLHVAAKNSTVEVAQALLDKGAQVDISTRLGILPLHEAVISNNLGVAEVLLKKGANPNIPLPPGINLMTFHIKSGGSDHPLTSQDASNATPLGLAQSEEMKTLLTKYGAKP